MNEWMKSCSQIQILAVDFKTALPMGAWLYQIVGAFRVFVFF
jgi:hypothetical protein